MRNEVRILGYPRGKPWISSSRPDSPKHLAGAYTHCCGERFLRATQTLSVSESLRLLLDGLIVDDARRFRSPGTQQGRLKALRLSGLGPPWTGRAESILDQTVFIQHGLGKVSSSQATGRFYPHTRAPLTHIHHPNQVQSRSFISDRGPRDFCFSIRHDCQNAPTCSSIWRQEDASVPLETFVAGLTSLLPHSFQMQSYYDLLGICARRNRCSGMQSIFKALHQEQSWWKVRTFLLLSQGMQSPSSEDSLLSSPRALGSFQKTFCTLV